MLLVKCLEAHDDLDTHTSVLPKGWVCLDFLLVFMDVYFWATIGELFQTTSYSNLKRSEVTGSLVIHRVWENQG